MKLIKRYRILKQKGAGSGHSSESIASAVREMFYFYKNNSAHKCLKCSAFGAFSRDGVRCLKGMLCTSFPTVPCCWSNEIGSKMSTPEYSPIALSTDGRGIVTYYENRYPLDIWNFWIPSHATIIAKELDNWKIKRAYSVDSKKKSWLRQPVPTIVVPSLKKLVKPTKMLAIPEAQGPPSVRSYQNSNLLVSPQFKHELSRHQLVFIWDVETDKPLRQLGQLIRSLYRQMHH